MESYFDIIIIGAGIAGLNLANFLRNTGKSVLIIEKYKKFFEKSCAGGISTSDLQFISKKFLNSEFVKPKIKFEKTVITASYNDNGVLATIKRERYLKELFNELKKFKNIKFVVGFKKLKISKSNEIWLNDKKICCKYLVGADGSNSVVRKYLQIPVKKAIVAIDYRVKKRFELLEFVLSSKLGGYYWIFPHKNFSSIGNGCFLNEKESGNLKHLLDLFCLNRAINLDTDIVKKSGGLVNIDFKGLQFGNIFLVGDSAGCANDLTAKGIYSAILSAKVVANRILGVNDDQTEKKFQRFLLKKKISGLIASLLFKKPARKIKIKIAMCLLRSKFVQNIAIRLLK